MSCSSRHKDVVSRIKNFMRDTAVKAFDDPATYQFVSIRVDTFRGSDYIHNIREIYKPGDTVLFSESVVESNLKKADSLAGVANYKDSIIDYETTVRFRAKNKIGALILDSVTLIYYPVLDQIKVRQSS